MMPRSSLSEAVFTEEETKVNIEDIDVECSGPKKEEWVDILVMLVNEDG